MKIQAFVFTFFLISMFSCDFSKSVHKDLITGMVTKGDGLSCDDVQLFIGEEAIQRNSFTYGEEFYVNFENIEGFDRVDNFAYPGMQLIVISKGGDTVLKNNDLYSDLTDGIDYSPLVLHAEVTIADPIYSNNGYSLIVNIWDKKGEGTFTADLDFDVVPNDQIEIESNHISYDEIYLFSQQRQIVITDNTAGFNERIYMMFEGLEGFTKEAGTVYLGLSITVMDSEGSLILNEEDLLGESGLNYSEINSRLAPNFILTGTHISNPVICEITIWDKKGDGNIKASVQMNIE